MAILPPCRSFKYCPGAHPGITEFLPVSSTAHLVLAPWLLGWTDPGLTFDIAFHVGTLIAVLVYFFRTWLQIIAQAIRRAIRG